MASLNLQLETNLLSNGQVIELLLQLKSAKAHSKNCIKVKPDLVRHLLRNRLFRKLLNRSFPNLLLCSRLELKIPPVWKNIIAIE